MIRRLILLGCLTAGLVFLSPSAVSYAQIPVICIGAGCQGPSGPTGPTEQEDRREPTGRRGLKALLEPRAAPASLTRIRSTLARALTFVR
jgi:hypothetical protein